MAGSDPLRIILAGATGQTGGTIAVNVQQHPDFCLTAGISHNRPAGDKSPSFLIVTRLEEAPEADVVIDFSHADLTPTLAKACADRVTPLVTGTTGLSADQQKVLTEVSGTIPVLQSGNMSLGVNLLMALVEQAAERLSGYDIEVTEAHHRRKKDAPSGTALMLGEAAAKGRGTTLTQAGTFARHGQTGPRKDGEIGFSVIRGGGVRGDHDVGFYGENEVLSLSHRALDRNLFAQGALQAAKWIHDQPPGFYSMRDVLAL